ncbi:MAG: hypothetical protein J5496_07415 [Lachnospiraceae bacterium]|nr:hypothetical protein [Lachnospiraceae bacterium]
MLLAVLGLVLLILIMVLCVPIRYEIRGRMAEELKAKAGVSWLLKLVHVKLEAIRAQIRVRVCVFGHAFKKMYLGNWGDQAPETDKKEEKTAEEAAEAKEEIKKEEEEVPAEAKEAESAEPKQESAKAAENGKTAKTKKSRPTPKEKYDELFEELQRRREEKERAEAEAASAAAPPEEAAEEEAAEEDASFPEKAAAWIEKISEFWEDEKNQNAVYLIERQLLKLGKHLIPTRFLLQGELGLGDPAKTGRLIGTVYRFYPLFGDHIQLEGVFDEKRTNLYLELKGRIRLGILVEIAVRLLLNGRIRRWIRTFTKKDKKEKTEKTDKKEKTEKSAA